MEVAMESVRQQRLTPAKLLRLQEDDAGNLYWRGRRINVARNFAAVFVLVAVVGAICQAVATVLAVGRSAGWWP
jgi:hypothetical protein